MHVNVVYEWPPKELIRNTSKIEACTKKDEVYDYYSLIYKKQHEILRNETVCPRPCEIITYKINKVITDENAEGITSTDADILKGQSINYVLEFRPQIIYIFKNNGLFYFMQ